MYASIKDFNIYRSADGNNVYAHIYVKPSKNAIMSASKLRLTYSTSGFDAINSSTIDISDEFDITSVGSGGRGRTISVGSSGFFDSKSNYYFTLNFYDGLNHAKSAHGVIFGAQFPIMVSKNNFGVAIGGVASGMFNDPRFTCHWPAYFSGGIASWGSPWYLMDLGNGVINFAGASLRCRKVADKCTIEGRVSVKPGSSTIVLGYLPGNGEGWIPNADVFAIAPCEGTDNPRIARIVVAGSGTSNAGALCLSWVKNIKDGSSFTSDSIWVQCNIEYHV